MFLGGEYHRKLKDAIRLCLEEEAYLAGFIIYSRMTDRFSTECCEPVAYLHIGTVRHIGPLRRILAFGFLRSSAPLAHKRCNADTVITLTIAEPELNDQFLEFNLTSIPCRHKLVRDDLISVRLGDLMGFDCFRHGIDQFRSNQVRPKHRLE